MFGFDAIGRAAFGQITRAGPSDVSLLASRGSYTIVGDAAVFNGTLTLGSATYSITGNAVGLKSVMPATAGTYAVSGGISLLPGRVAAASGGYVLAGQLAGFKWNFPALTSAYVLTGAVVPLRDYLAASGGAYNRSFGGARSGLVVPFSGGAYILTPGSYVLTRTGGDHDQVYGGIGHYLEELERLRQLARITRPAPRPVMHEMRPQLRPLAPVPLSPAPGPMAAMATPVGQAIHLQAVHLQDAARRLADDIAQQQAAVARRRRQEAEILLLVG